jgi:hypothetical protein
VKTKITSQIRVHCTNVLVYKGNNKITELRTILQKESQNNTCTCIYTYKYINGKTKYPLIQQCDMAEVIHLALPVTNVLKIVYLPFALLKVQIIRKRVFHNLYMEIND